MLRTADTKISTIYRRIPSVRRRKVYDWQQTSNDRG